MASTQTSSFAAQQNLLLNSLQPDDLRRLLQFLEPVAVRSGARIGASVSAPMHVYFPTTLVASVAALVEGGDPVEVGLVGREGMLGWPVLLGGHHAPHCGLAQLSGGEALAMPAATLIDLCAEHRTLHTALLRFVQAFTVQLGRTVVANLRDGLERRLSRWLLMLHDRIDGDTLPITHVELANTLHVRRASVTDTLHVLEGNGVLRCTRGQVYVRDRAQLQVAAGESYGPAERSYSGLIAPFGKSDRADPTMQGWGGSRGSVDGAGAGLLRL
ncbi:cAMP-binding domain of CRP or a regulatory subunit of cAMP-dependent protein kinases [Sphingomonas guangdongensis]|uniref:cAMP-binding domain of CRP or a regulatory subunit of cAMP-dependent protein kinases n=1 Tax=Sphingomonas guangdongensis TaxID=1141890 RepID=A0A285Q9I6_9SPHN|nr:Crp/Fnr family transcriptional regulator [Sphingomonas guangdongensis]SOB78590.1 cAMP-binding domain of CRP or a regulatory subunit of cAMP-dependent protein kinases [Sphingomonas guangdongensis]